MDQRAKRDTGGAFGKPGFGVVVPSGSGDIEVDPRRVACEFLDEHSASDGAAAFAAADILNVCHCALDEFTIVVVDRHLPHFFAGHFGTGQQLVGEGLIGAKDSNVDVREGHNDRTGESGSIDQMRSAELLGVVNAVGEN